MKATIAFHEPTRSTLFNQTATGHAVVVELPPRLCGKVVILVDDPDNYAVERLLAGSSNEVQVTDMITGQTHFLKRADCGAGCKCAVAFA